MRCYFIYTSNCLEPSPVAHLQQEKEKTERQREFKNKRGKLLSECRQNPHQGLLTSSAGSCCSQNVTDGCLGRKPSPFPNGALGNAGGLEPALPFPSKPLLQTPTEKKRERERKNGIGMGVGGGEYALETFLPVCFLVES